MLRIQGLYKSYGTKRAVDGVDLNVQPGEVFGFLGPNGAGKTTTIKMIVGLLKPDQGTISINGIDNQKDLFQAKQQFSYVPDGPELFEKISGYQYLQFIGDVFKVPLAEREERIKRLAEIFELSDDLDTFIGSYSHGMRQKTALIGALLPNPKLLVIDEPMVGLDPKAQYNLRTLLKEHCQKGNSVFLSTHVLDTAEKVCDRVAIINKGKIIAMETINEEKIKNRSLEQMFLEMTNV